MNTAEVPYPLCDLALARRLERTEADANMRFVETRAKFFPETGACWIEVAGAHAMFDGVPSSPLTQTFGLGMQNVTGADMEKIEEFYHSRGSPVFHEISPLADAGLLPLLNERGYQPFEFTSIMFRPIWPDVQLSTARNAKITVKLLQENEQEQELWVRTTLTGWGDMGDFNAEAPNMIRLGIKRPAASAFLAELDGRVIATGSSSIYDGVVLLAGACTIPEARNRGAQLALLETRLRAGAAQGCNLAMMGAAPGSSSQRNAERHGFRIAYTRIKWRLAPKTT